MGGEVVVVVVVVEEEVVVEGELDDDIIESVDRGGGVEVDVDELLLEVISLLPPSKQESGKPPRAKFISSRLQGENSRTTCPVETAPGHMRKFAPESAFEQSRPAGSWPAPKLCPNSCRKVSWESTRDNFFPRCLNETKPVLKPVLQVGS